MKYTFNAPPDVLRDYVQHLWTFGFDRTEPVDKTLNFFVSCAPCIVFQHDNGRSAIARSSRTRHGEVPVLSICGPVTQPFQCVTAGAHTAIGVELKPHAIHTLFRLDAAELADTVVELDAVSGNNLEDQLLNAPDQQGQIASLVEFLRTKADGLRRNDSLVIQSLRLIHGHVGSMRVGDLLRQLNVSERHFERRFQREVGIPPALYLRINRFQRAVRLLKMRQFERLSDVAYDLEYSDQSHFIKEIRAFTGYTPKTLSQAIEGDSAAARHRTLIRERVLAQ